MFTKLGRDEVHMARHMHKDVLAIFAQGADPGQGKIGHGSGWGVGGGGGGFPSSKNSTATNQIHSNDLEACVMKCCCFWFHSVVKFLCPRIE